VLVAAMKCGFPILFASHYNGTGSLLSLMAETDCKALVSTLGVGFDEFRERCGLPSVEMLSLERLSFDVSGGRTPNHHHG
jgi:hypothetical protein